MGRKRREKHGGNPGWHGRVWLEGDEGTFIGYGRAVLLEKIQATGSIAGAAKEMSMSYRHAWQLVESMNRQAGGPVVRTSRGGKGGGGAELTPTGRELLALFWRVEKKMAQFLARETAAWRGARR
ncbi:MAG: ModE family transcriptional regulator [Thermodesulfobacteriota bacterium]